MGNLTQRVSREEFPRVPVPCVPAVPRPGTPADDTQLTTSAPGGALNRAHPYVPEPYGYGALGRRADQINPRRRKRTINVDTTDSALDQGVANMDSAASVGSTALSNLGAALEYAERGWARAPAPHIPGRQLQLRRDWLQQPR